MRSETSAAYAARRSANMERTLGVLCFFRIALHYVSYMLSGAVNVVCSVCPLHIERSTEHLALQDVATFLRDRVYAHTTGSVSAKALGLPLSRRWGSVRTHLDIILREEP